MHPSQQPTIIIKPTITYPNLDEEFKELSPSYTNDPMKLTSHDRSPKIPAISNLASSENSDAQAQAVRQSQRLLSISIIRKGTSKIHSSDTDEFIQENYLTPEEHYVDSFTDKNKRNNTNYCSNAVSNFNNNSSTEDGNNQFISTERTHKLQRKTSSVLSHPSSLEAGGICTEGLDKRFPTLVTTTTATTTTGATGSSAKRKQTKNSLVPCSGIFSRQSSSGGNSLSRNSCSVLNGTTPTTQNLFTFEPLDDDLVVPGVRLNQQNTVIVDSTPRTPSSQQDNNASYSNNTLIHLIPSNRGDDLANTSPRKNNKMDSNYSMSSFRSDENKGNTLDQMKMKKKKFRLQADCEIGRRQERNDGLKRQQSQKEEEKECDDHDQNWYQNQEQRTNKDNKQLNRNNNNNQIKNNNDNKDGQIGNLIPAQTQLNSHTRIQMQNLRNDFKDLQVKSTLSYQFNEEFGSKQQIDNHDDTHLINLKGLSKSREITSQQPQNTKNNCQNCTDISGCNCQEQQQYIQHDQSHKNSKINNGHNNNINNRKDSQAIQSSKTTPGTQIPSFTPFSIQSNQKNNQNIPSSSQQQDISILNHPETSSQSNHQSLLLQSHEILTKLQNHNGNISNIMSQHINNFKLIKILLRSCQSPFYISEFTVRLYYSLFPNNFLQKSILNQLRLQGNNLMIAYCDTVIQRSPFYMILQYFYELFCSAIRLVVFSLVIGIICTSLIAKYNNNQQLIFEVFQWIIWLSQTIQGILIVALNIFECIQHKQSAVKTISLITCILQIILISILAIFDTQESSTDILLISVILPIIHVLSQLIVYYSLYKICKALRLFQTAMEIQSEDQGYNNNEIDQTSKQNTKKIISNSKNNQV